MMASAMNVSLINILISLAIISSTIILWPKKISWMPANICSDVEIREANENREHFEEKPCRSTATKAGPKTQVNHAPNVQNRSCSCHCPLSIFRAEELRKKPLKNRRCWIETEGWGVGVQKRMGRTVADDKSSLASCLSVAMKEKLKNKSHRQQHKQRTADDAASTRTQPNVYLADKVSWLPRFDRGQQIWSP